MALVTTPNRIHPAFNPIYFEVTEGDQIQISFVSELGEQRVFLSRIAIDGIIGSDVSGVVKHIFREAREALDLGTTEPFAWVDYRLKSDYIVNSEIFTAVNAVRQPGYDLETDLYLPALTEIKPDGNTIRIPKYKGYPTGVSLLYNSGYGEDTSKYLIYQVTVTAGEQSLVPLFNQTTSSANSIRVDWGDGTELENYTLQTSSNSIINCPVHTYTSAGTYTITVSINIGAIQILFNTAGNNIGTLRNTIVGVIQFAPMVYRYNFSNCINLVSIPKFPVYTGPGVEEVPLFNGCTNFSEFPDDVFHNLKGGNTFSNMFQGCTSITSFPSGLLKTFTTVTNAQNMCYGMTNLTSIPIDFFSEQTEIITFAYTFYSCTSLKAIPVNLFMRCGKVTNFNYTFGGCIGLTSGGLPEDIFSYNTTVTQFNYTFRQCSGITTLKPWFKNCTSVTSFQGTFSYCTGVTTIISNLFSTNTAVTSFAETFEGCTGITRIALTIFYYNTNVTTFARTFSGCTKLNGLVTTLFSTNSKVTIFQYCFQNTGLTVIPDSLFNQSTYATDFSFCFSSCKQLTRIPEGLFKNCSAATNFNHCFSESGIDSTPNTLFPDSGTVQIYLTGTFYACPNLYSIGPTLFQNIAKRIPGFQRTFCGCTSLTRIPMNLFANCSNATFFGSTSVNANLSQQNGVFQGCTALSGIPTNLLDDMPMLTSVAYMFAQCTTLTNIPINIFDNNPNIVNAKGSFYNCINVTSESPGTTQKLWERGNITAYLSCFYNCTKMYDYASIPNTWKTQI